MEDGPLTAADLQSFQARLLDRREQLQTEREAKAAGRSALSDPPFANRPAGRRRDARDAMAEVQEVRRAQELRRVEAALLRMRAGSFGRCTRCGDPLPRKHLELDPTVPHCIDCSAP